MAKRPATKAPPARPPARRTMRIVVLLAAAALTALAARQAYTLWHRLPGPSLTQLDWDAVRERQNDLTGQAREGFLLVILSEHFTDALHHPDHLDAWMQDARDGATLTPHTQVARLQLAALTMLGLENEGVPLAEWWPRLHLYLDGLDNATFDHFLPDVIDARAGALIEHGLPPGTARHLALYQVGHKHGPFLQVFAARMRALIGELRTTGDAEAAGRCEQVLRRLLRAWVLNPGPASVRLLAADLLSDNLAGSSAPAAEAIAADLRAWRAAYRAAAVGQSVSVSVLRMDSEPTTADDRSLITWLGLLIWTAAMLVVLTPVGLLGAVLGVVRGGAGGRRWQVPLLVAVPGLLSVAIGGIVLALWPDLAADDLLRLQQLGRDIGANQRLGPPRLVLAGLATACAYALLLLMVALPRSAAGTRRPRVVRVAAGSWLSASIAVVVLAFGAEGARRDYETILAQSPGRQIEQIAGPQTDAHLAALRAWHP